MSSTANSCRKPLSRPTEAEGREHHRLGRRAIAAGNWAAVLLVAGLFHWSSTADAKVSLVYGVYTSDKPSTMVRQFRPSLDLIAKAAGEILG